MCMTQTLNEKRYKKDLVCNLFNDMCEDPCKVCLVLILTFFMVHFILCRLWREVLPQEMKIVPISRPIHKNNQNFISNLSYFMWDVNGRIGCVLPEGFFTQTTSEMGGFIFQTHLYAVYHLQSNWYFHTVLHFLHIETESA